MASVVEHLEIFADAVDVVDSRREFVGDLLDGDHADLKAVGRVGVNSRETLGLRFPFRMGDDNHIGHFVGMEILVGDVFDENGRGECCVFVPCGIVMPFGVRGVPNSLVSRTRCVNFVDLYRVGYIPNAGRGIDAAELEAFRFRMEVERSVGEAQIPVVVNVDLVKAGKVNSTSRIVFDCEIEIVRFERE